jgi:hypothetical protein
MLNGFALYVQHTCLEKPDFFVGGAGYSMSKGQSGPPDKLMIPRGDDDANNRES